jgi:hypothetical protein
LNEKKRKNSGMFGNEVVVVFQSVFRAECVKMIFFYVLKIIFKISTSKHTKKIYF